MDSTQIIRQLQNDPAMKAVMRAVHVSLSEIRDIKSYLEI
jgi:hypothetical protein